MAAMNVGQAFTHRAEFRDVDGALVDPASVTWTGRDPSDVDTVYVYGTDVELVKDSTGLYHVNGVLSAAGRWYFKFDGSGVGVSEDTAIAVETVI